MAAPVNPNVSSSMDIEKLLNNFATRSFRDTADMDYIAARLSHRANLLEQFHWQSLQAIEKYFKAILLYNRIKAKNIGHSLSKALGKTQALPFRIQLTDKALEFIRHIDSFGRFRYLEASYYVRGYKLVELDKTIWEIRRYCTVIDYSRTLDNGEEERMLPVAIERIRRSEESHPMDFKLPGGLLEEIVENKQHPARSALIWQNGFFGKSRRRRVSARSNFTMKNSPLTLNPELLDAVKDYIFLPKEVIDAYSGQS